MPTFLYKARDRAGKLITGQMDGSSRKDIAGLVGEMGYFPISIEEKGGKEATRTSGQENAGAQGLSLKSLKIFNRVKADEILFFTRQLATVIKAGIPITTGLSVLAEQAKNPLMKEAILDILDRIKEGVPLSNAMAHYPIIFSDIYIHMVQAGEASGKLEEVLNRISFFLEYDIETKRRIKSATRYPKMVFGALIGAFLFAIYFIIPKFMGMFKSFKTELPLPTRMMIGLHYIFSNYWYIIFGVIGGAVGLFYWYVRTEQGRLNLDIFKIKVPIMGPVFLKIFMSRFTRMFTTLNRSGLPMLQTLEIAASTIGNVFISNIIIGIQQSVREGGSLSDRMKDKSIFPPLVYQMFAVGEASGTLDDILDKVSDFYDREIDNSIKNLSSLIEPIMIVFMGAMMLFLAMAVFMPMWDMAKMARGGGG
ncbi:MAG TPA: type II secretion system F family protein [Thermodesulfobacteriota bacterium]|nr:type II secretion system F family protein [Thermodesulfobacteriota bacterium]